MIPACCVVPVLHLLPSGFSFLGVAGRGIEPEALRQLGQAALTGIEPGTSGQHEARTLRGKDGGEVAVPFGRPPIPPGRKSLESTSGEEHATVSRSHGSGFGSPIATSPGSSLHASPQGSPVGLPKVKTGSSSSSPRDLKSPRKGYFGEEYPSAWKEPRLFIVSSGESKTLA